MEKGYLWQNCNKSAFILETNQLWRLKGTTLKTYWSKNYYNYCYNCWKSTDEWNFQSEGSLIYIENTSENNKVLGVTGNKVILEAKDENKPGQLWIKGEQIYRDQLRQYADGTQTFNRFTGFTLRSFESPAKFLTPVGSLSTSGFEIKGNIHRREF